LSPSSGLQPHTGGFGHGGTAGYRSALIEAGYTCQNLIFAAAGIGLGVFPFELFHDAMIANLDPATQWPIYLAAVGKEEKSVTVA
jgi:nitroreductase